MPNQFFNLLNYIMKNFTKLLLILALFAFTSQTFAQVSHGLRVGASFSKQLFQVDGEDAYDDMKMQPGGHLGFIMDITIKEPFSIETGLILNTKGFRRKYSVGDVDVKEYNYLLYLDIPINAKYTFDLGGPKFYLTAGPYLAYGVFGKGGAIGDDGNTKETEEWDFTWGKEEDHSHKRLDIGLGFGGGFQFGGFVIGANYGIGLKNISTLGDYDFVTKNRFLNISIGTNFGG
jgi:hypothetical protein